MRWMLLPLKRYADFSGRSRPREYWMFMLLNMLVGFGLLAIMIVGIFMGDFENNEMSPLALVATFAIVIWSLGTILPIIAVHVRRFHDQDKSGWFYLLNFIPFVGGFIIIYFMILPGTSGTNQYGPDPLAPEQLGDVFD